MSSLTAETIRQALRCGEPGCPCDKPDGLVHCPAHADTTPSLSVNEQDGKILVKCHGRCEQDRVISALKEKGVWPSRSVGQPAFKVEKTYDYLDSAGKLVYQVCRLDPKDFRQRRPDPQRPGKWIWKIAGVKPVPFRLPDILKADMVYITEGEKDCNNLAALGLVATTNPGGAGKWRKEYNRHFTGKRVIIFSDNDEAGRAHALAVARHLHGVAVSVKVVELPGLPKKGDVSDWLDGGGTIEQLLALVEAAPEWQPAAEIKKESALDDPLSGTSYLVEDGRLCHRKSTKDGVFTVPLCNFTAHCTEELIKDDGRGTTREFLIGGALDTGQLLPQAVVKANEFRGMGWINRHWGMAANISAGQSAQDRVREAIQHLSKKARQRTIYTHSGWRKLNGVWVFLHGGGAINGPEGIEVDLGPDLSRYCLPKPGSMEAAQASFQLLDIAPPEITYPFQACIYLSVLAELLKVNFTLWPLGPTGSLKSTISALFLSHFGDFTELTLPGQWSSTANALERRAFILKDLPFVIDDYAPQHDHRRASEMEAKAHRIIRAAGNRGGRQRLTSEMTERQTYDPRSLIISTGEITPTGQSLAARYFPVEIDRSKIDLSKLTAAQKAKYLYPQAMSGYLHHLAPRLDDTLQMVRELWQTYREMAQSNAHLRVPEMVAWLMVGFELFLRFQHHMGVIADTYNLEQKSWQIFKDLSVFHARLIEGERPTLKFLNILRELFIQKRVYVQGMDGNSPPEWESLGWQAYDEPALYGEHIGWTGDGFLYLMPESTFKAVQKSIRDQGGYLGVGKNELLKALAREGFIDPDASGENTRSKWAGGGSRRVLYVNAQTILG